MGKTSLASKVDRHALAWRCAGLVVATSVALTGCSAPGTAPNATRERGFDPRQLIKTDINRVAETHQQHIFASLRRLADKLYKRNPREWRKAGAPSAEAAISRIFDEQHRWRFESLGNRRDLDALHVALHPEFRGDRVQALIVGLGSMVQSAFGDREVFTFWMISSLSTSTMRPATSRSQPGSWRRPVMGRDSRCCCRTSSANRPTSASSVSSAASSACSMRCPTWSRTRPNAR
ncbi:hypothetical protein [Thauera humireducens]|uniref:hypothetical protein n=1 Tax=Thauera humireducens TaxID=1134435 RepID=UPI0031204D58